MDKIEIKITRNCDADGNGGEVVDHAAAILGNVANNGPLVDAIVAAFQDAYGLHEVDEVPVSGYRNVAYRMRQHMTEIVISYLKKTAIAQVDAAIEQQVGVTLGNVTIVDQV
jgi:hypothetical protein